MRDRNIRRMDDEMRTKFGRGPSTMNMKIVVQGSSKSGKSAFVRRLEGRSLDPSYKPTSELYSTNINWNSPVSSHVVKLEIWEVPAARSTDDELPPSPFPDSNPTSPSTNTNTNTHRTNKHHATSTSSPVSSQKSTTWSAGSASGESVNLYRGCCAVIVMINPNRADSFEWALKEVPRMPKDVKILVLNNFKDDLKLGSSDTAHIRESLQEYGRHVYVYESSMANCFGLKEINRFFFYLFLGEEKRVLEDKLLENANRMVEIAEEVKDIAFNQHYATYMEQNRDKIGLLMEHRGGGGESDDPSSPSPTLTTTPPSKNRNDASKKKKKSTTSQVVNEQMSPIKVKGGAISTRKTHKDPEDELRDFYDDDDVLEEYGDNAADFYDDDDDDESESERFEEDDATAASLKLMAKSALTMSSPVKATGGQQSAPAAATAVMTAAELGGGIDDSFFDDDDEEKEDEAEVIRKRLQEETNRLHSKKNKKVTKKDQERIASLERAAAQAMARKAQMRSFLNEDESHEGARTNDFGGRCRGRSGDDDDDDDSDDDSDAPNPLFVQAQEPDFFCSDSEEEESGNQTRNASSSSNSKTITTNTSTRQSPFKKSSRPTVVFSTPLGGAGNPMDPYPDHRGDMDDFYGAGAASGEGRLVEGEEDEDDEDGVGEEEVGIQGGLQNPYGNDDDFYGGSDRRSSLTDTRNTMQKLRAQRSMVAEAAHEGSRSVIENSSVSNTSFGGPVDIEVGSAAQEAIRMAELALKQAQQAKIQTDDEEDIVTEVRPAGKKHRHHRHKKHHKKHHKHRRRGENDDDDDENDDD